MLYVVFALMIVVGLVLLKFIKTRRHLEQVAHLERQYVDVLTAEGSLLVKSETA